MLIGMFLIFLSEIETVVGLAESMDEHGSLVVIGAVFLFISITVMIGVFTMFRSIVKRLMNDFHKQLECQSKDTREMKELLTDIAESLRPANELQIKGISATCFDLAREQVCKLIKQIKRENHICDVPNTKKKINALLITLHDNRNSRLDNISYHGKPLSHYVNKEWIDWVADVMMKEVYDEIENEDRTSSNVRLVYDKIKLDFYRRLKI